MEKLDYLMAKKLPKTNKDSQMGHITAKQNIKKKTFGSSDVTMNQ